MTENHDQRDHPGGAQPFAGPGADPGEVAQGPETW